MTRGLGILMKTVTGVKTSNLSELGDCDWLVITFEDGTELEVSAPQVNEYRVPFSIKVGLKMEDR